MWITTASRLIGYCRRQHARARRAERLRKQQEGWQMKHRHPRSFGCTQEHFRTHAHTHSHVKTGRRRKIPSILCSGICLVLNLLWLFLVFVSVKLGAPLDDDDDEHGGWLQPSVKDVRRNVAASDPIGWFNKSQFSCKLIANPTWKLQFN